MYNNAALTVALPPPHQTLTPEGAGVRVERSYSYQGGQLLGRKATELRKLGQERPCHYGSHHRHAAQQFFVLAPGGALFDRLLEIPLDARELLLQPPDVCASRRLRTALVVATPRRLFSAVSIPTTCRRRAVISANAWASSSGTSLGDGRTAWAKRARI